MSGETCFAPSAIDVESVRYVCSHGLTDGSSQSLYMTGSSAWKHFDWNWIDPDTTNVANYPPKNTNPSILISCRHHASLEYDTGTTIQTNECLRLREGVSQHVVYYLRNPQCKYHTEHKAPKHHPTGIGTMGEPLRTIIVPPSISVRDSPIRAGILNSQFTQRSRPTSFLI